MDRTHVHAPAPPEGDGLEAELGWSLHRVMAAYRLTAVGAVADLPGGARGYQVLVAAEEGRPSSQLALAHRLAIDKTSMTYLVDDLEGAGLVTRRPDPADRRVKQVIATPTGRAALERSRGKLRTVEDQLIGALDAQEADQLRKLLVRVALSVDEAVPCITTTPAAAQADAEDPAAWDS